MENLFKEKCIRTYTGLYVNVFDPKPEMIDILDIAHSLSNLCRFNGHLPKFYSVAQHSVFCCNNVYNKYKLAALLHDASEAYLVDIPRPVKIHLINYNQIEDNLMKVIAEKFGFKYPLQKAVKDIDDKMLVSEWECLMLKGAYKDFSESELYWIPEYAENIFLQTFNVLQKLK